MDKKTKEILDNEKEKITNYDISIKFKKLNIKKKLLDDRVNQAKNEDESDDEINNKNKLPSDIVYKLANDDKVFKQNLIYKKLCNLNPKSKRKDVLYSEEENIYRNFCLSAYNIKNILTNNNREGNKLNGKNEFNLKSEHPNEKPNSSLSSLISNELKCNTNNNQYKTPLRKGSSPLNYKQKPKYNYQEKLNMEKGTGTQFKNHRNSISIRSPIYSYFDESQKFLNEHYSEENIFNLPGNNKNKNKTSSNKEIKKKIHKKKY